MITKWFIQIDTQKGRGVLNREFEDDSESSYGWAESKPKCTRQTALAIFFNTKAEAEDKIKKWRATAEARIVRNTELIETQKTDYANWKNKTDIEKIAIFEKRKLKYYGLDPNNYWDEKPITVKDFPTYPKDILKKVLKDPREIDDSFSDSEELIKIYTSRLEWIKRFITVEKEFTIKFNDASKLQLEWQERSENESNNEYCNCCGGAIPGIPQLRIGWQVFICAICMGKLAQEAEIQAGKIDQEILDHYETDRFLRSV